MHAMIRTRTLAVLALSVLVVGATAASGATFDQLSHSHTRYGVSQLLVGDHHSDSDAPFKLNNPTPVHMIATVLVYERVFVDEFDSGSEDAAPVTHPDTSGFNDNDHTVGRYIDCVNLSLAPHASIGFGDDLTAINEGSGWRLALEVIAVPRRPVRIRGAGKGRLADGLGLNGGTKHYRNFDLVHPGLFSLPVDSSERSDAIDCMCRATGFTGATADLWSDVGVTCP